MMEALWCPLRGRYVQMSECVGGCPAPEQRVVCAMEFKRPKASHVSRDGAAKATFETEADARRRANEINAVSGKRLWPYLCSQRPEHYHLTHDQPPLKEAR